MSTRLVAAGGRYRQTRSHRADCSRTSRSSVSRLFGTPKDAAETDTPFTSLLEAGQVLRAPIAHGEGNYFADDATLSSETGR